MSVGARLAASAIVALLAACSEAPTRPQVVLGATHTLEDAGLLDALAEEFRTAHPDLALRVVVSGTGEALAYAGQGQLDVVLSHAPEAERAALERGDVTARRELMHNDFMIAGPASDPAGVRDAADARAAMARIAATRSARFVSRDDDSGTHMRELALWQAAGIAPPAGDSYIRAGVGMADALRIADQRQAYILTDPATYTVLRHSLALVPLQGSGPDLRNTYSVMRVTRAPDSAAARLLAGWLTGAAARRVILRFGVEDYGGPLFTPADTAI